MSAENVHLVAALDWALRRIRTSLDCGERYEWANTVLVNVTQGKEPPPPPPPAGWKLVPTEPTPEMLEAGLIQWDLAESPEIEENLGAEYKAMVQAAPPYNPETPQ